MLPYYLVAVAQTMEGMKLSPRYDRFDDALRSARLMLGDGAFAAWILDRDGSLVFHAEQERGRIGHGETSHSRARSEAGRDDAEYFTATSHSARLRSKGSQNA